MIQKISFNDINFKSNSKNEHLIKATELQESSTKKDASMEALEKLAQAEKSIQEAKKAIISTLREKQEEKRKILLSQKIEAATTEYQQRLNKNMNISERLRAIVCSYDYGTYQISQTRLKQLKNLSDEQIAALDDKMLKNLAMYKWNTSGVIKYQYETEFNNFQFLQSLTPEEIIKIQEDPDCRGDFLSLLHTWKTPEKSEELMDIIKTKANS